MFIRFKDWNLINDQEQVHVEEISNIRYKFWKKDKGVCDVRDKAHIERLISPRNSAEVRYEVAYENYGIFFGENGVQKETGTSVIESSQNGSVSFSQDESPHQDFSSLTKTSPLKKMTVSEKISRMREARNRNRIAHGKPPIKFKS